MADPVRCATCLYWTEGASPLATAAPGGDPLAKPNIGTCSLYPPVMSDTLYFPVSVFPEVHADRFCGDWEPGGASGGPPADNVVKLDVAA